MTFIFYPKPVNKRLHMQLTWHAIIAAYYAHLDRADLASGRWRAIAKLCEVNGGVQRGAAS
jgi:hypothetical protein